MPPARVAAGGGPSATAGTQGSDSASPRTAGERRPRAARLKMTLIALTLLSRPQYPQSPRVRRVRGRADCAAGAARPAIRCAGCGTGGGVALAR